MRYFLPRQLTVGLTLFLAVIILYPVQSYSLTISEENELGREFFDYAKRHFRLVKDPFINYYINYLGKELVQTFPNPMFEYRFFVIQEDAYNAFAAPGGYIFVNSGLIRAMNSEEELAGILAHEIAHVNCRHISEKIEKSKKVSLATLAGLAASVFLGAATGVPGSAIAIGSAAAGEAAMLAYSRDDERQADQLGLRYLCQAGYSPEGLLTILKKIKSKEWFDSDDIPTYLTTHPAINERIAYLDTLKTPNGFAVCNPPLQPISQDFKIMITKIRAEYSDESFAAKTFKTHVEEQPDGVLGNYGYGLVLARKARYTDAIYHFKTALAADAFNPHILKDLGQAYFLTGQYEKALGILENIPRDGFYDPMQQFFLARTLGELGEPARSASILKELTERNPESVAAFYHLGKTYGQHGKMKEAHFYLGLYYKETGEQNNALFHLKKALELYSETEKKEEIKELMAEIKKPKGRRRQ